MNKRLGYVLLLVIGVFICWTGQMWKENLPEKVIQKEKTWSERIHSSEDKIVYWDTENEDKLVFGESDDVIFFRGSNFLFTEDEDMED